jgi:predicted nucleotidyltransferase
MIAELENHRTNIADLCRRYGVQRLDVFGSAATAETFNPDRSDLDLLVEFDAHPEMGPADQYFGLLEELENLFQRMVDLVSVRGLRNRYFIASVNRTKQVLYAD